VHRIEDICPRAANIAGASEAPTIGRRGRATAANRSPGHRGRNRVRKSAG
jgi:hypothetical protein